MAPGKEYQIKVNLLESDYSTLRATAERLDLSMAQTVRILIRESASWRRATDVFGNPLG